MGGKLPVRLAGFEEKYREDLLAFRLPAEQAKFTGMPEETLDEALSNAGKIPVVILAGEQPVGFFVLHTGEDIASFYAKWPETVLLRAFLVDQASQGQGIARAGLALLPCFVRNLLPAVREIVLAVNERNDVALALYARAGFRDYGLRRSGMKGQQRIMQYPLQDEPLPGPQGYMDQEEALRRRLIGHFRQSPLLMEVFRLVRELEPYPYYIGAGCLVQTVWNGLSGRQPDYGIGDIDIIYYDGEDLSYEAEDRMIARGRKLFADAPLPVDLKNQARVHLWYERKFGVRLAPYTSLEAAIDSWPTTVTSLGVRWSGEDEWHIYAPFGLGDLFAMELRANKALVTEEVYRNKTDKWQRLWPELKVEPWTPVGAAR
ncbi:nucleotidyltransferase family protein [Paenibacillus tepidiphilus]|uniref:nucleotidyltransferase family protein n=1 Tax=Paenibacillus tepidiphilus TaxID=2608683 RepID=UPI0012388E84|nr:nucleotidyltransferase family protein [Paenibacillus tepidiphilus]